MSDEKKVEIKLIGNVDNVLGLYNGCPVYLWQLRDAVATLIDQYGDNAEVEPQYTGYESYETELWVIYERDLTSEEEAARLMEERRQEVKGKIQYRKSKIKRLQTEINSLEYSDELVGGDAKLKRMIAERQIEKNSYQEQLEGLEDYIRSGNG